MQNAPAPFLRPPLDTKPDFELTFYISQSHLQTFSIELAVVGLPPAKGGHQSPIHIENRHVDRARLLLEALARLTPSNFAPLRCAVALELTLYSPVQCPPGDALNFLGGVGDVLQRKPPHLAGHLGTLADLALYDDDRQIRRVRFDQRTAADLSYVVRIRAIGKDPLLADHLPARRRIPKVDSGRPVTGKVELAVAFANSTEVELSSYDSFLDWCVLHQALTYEIADALRLLGAKRPVAVDALMAEVRELRDAIRTLFCSGVVSPESLVVFTAARRRCGAHEVIELVGSVVSARCDVPVNDLGLPLCAIWASAAGVLGSDSRSRVRRCADETCGRVFLDESRNHTRRWCDMNDCGNRAKVRRFRARQRAPKAKATR